MPLAISPTQSQLHNYFYFYLFIKALQHKCWRSVGHQVLQPAKDGKLGQYVWKVADRRKNPGQQLLYILFLFLCNFAILTICKHMGGCEANKINE